MTLERLIAALSGGHGAQGDQGGAVHPNSRLMQALGLRRGLKPGDAKYRSLEALQPYAEQKYADRLGGSNGIAAGQSSDGAFQWDAYQDDGYQV